MTWRRSMNNVIHMPKAFWIGRLEKHTSSFVVQLHKSKQHRAMDNNNESSPATSGSKTHGTRGVWMGADGRPDGPKVQHGPSATVDGVIAGAQGGMQGWMPGNAGVGRYAPDAAADATIDDRDDASMAGRDAARDAGVSGGDHGLSSHS
ncbi:uncharacterized protein LOC125208050 [Salvia hispanica]|uniref:uncharacterized protein LOC125208050 n=1 Tax=Salvia hispanica TaxID=49212 RepID=UPI002008F775|nr:uncharacterized protein LOC125208050 [Salvia hispanica]